MRVYSKATESFLKRLKPLLEEIISREMGLTLKSKRILYKNFYYPINLVVFEGTQKHGYFDYRSFTVALNKRLMFEAKTEVIKDILRHELAHYYTYIVHGLKEIHGDDFKNVCRQFLWDERVIKATSSIDIENSKYEDQKFDRVQEKIKKLLALASSENHHEAELAMIRANELIIEYNLEDIKTRNQNLADEESFVDTVLDGTKKNSKHGAIYDILRTFQVAPVFNMSKGSFQLEVVGSKQNIELAKYVAGFLDHTLEELYLKEKKKNPKILSGLAAKNSFMKGIGLGYVEKIEKEISNSRNSQDLILLKSDLQRVLNRVYPRLGSSYSTGGSGNTMAKQLGEENGKKLSITPSLKNNSQTIFSLGWNK